MRRSSRASPCSKGAPGAPVPSALPPALRDRLIAAGIVVPEGFDERAALFDLRRRALDTPDALLLTLAPTIQCNFRCTYCFETHRQEVMTPAIEGDLVRFIAHRAEGVRAITTTWFGGEPLLRLDTLERVQRFTNELGEARGITIVRSIITNGYFLTADVVQRLQALGDWEMVQVTVDGPPQVHDSRRMLVGGGGTWNRIIDNCRLALDGGHAHRRARERRQAQRDDARATAGPSRRGASRACCQRQPRLRDERDQHVRTRGSGGALRRRARSHLDLVRGREAPASPAAVGGSAVSAVRPDVLCGIEAGIRDRAERPDLQVLEPGRPI